MLNYLTPVAAGRAPADSTDHLPLCTYNMCSVKAENMAVLL